MPTLPTLARLTIGPTERGLVMRDGRLERVLMPGRHWLAGLPGALTLERHDAARPELVSALNPLLLAMPAAILAPHLTLVAPEEGAVVLVSVDGAPQHLVEPGQRRLFWHDLRRITVETLPLDAEGRVPDGLLHALARAPELETRRWDLTVAPHELVLVTLDGRRLPPLGPGRHAFFKARGTYATQRLDLRLQTLEVQGQELLTRDRVGLRITVTAFHRITDAQRLADAVGQAAEFLHRQVQFALRRAVSQRTLDELLADKAALDAGLQAEVAPRAAEVGLALEGLSVKDILLPGDIREMMNRVLVAEREAQATLIRRREETAATRSLLNTARLMDENPTLMRLKELEALERVAERIGSLTVGGTLEDVLTKLVRIRPDAT